MSLCTLSNKELVRRAMIRGEITIVPPVHTKPVNKGVWTPEMRAAKSAEQIALHAPKNPVLQEAARRRWNPERSEKHRQLMRKHWTPERRKRHGEETRLRHLRNRQAAAGNQEQIPA